MNCYIFSWDRTGKDIDRQKILDFLDTISEVKNWKAVDGIILIVSDATAVQLNTQINQKFPTLRHLIAPITIDQIEGYTDQDTWDFIGNPRPV